MKEMTFYAMSSKTGKIIIAADINVWPHEMETAKALAAVGFTVEFVKKVMKTMPPPLMCSSITYNAK